MTLQRFSVERGKTKTTVTALANHNGHRKTFYYTPLPLREARKKPVRAWCRSFSNAIKTRPSHLCPGLNESIIWLVLQIWQGYLTLSYYFLFDRIVCVLVTFYQWGRFVMLIAFNPWHISTECQLPSTLKWKALQALKVAISGLAYLEKLSKFFLRSSFVIRVNLLFL